MRLHEVLKIKKEILSEIGTRFQQSSGGVSIDSNLSTGDIDLNQGNEYTIDTETDDEVLPKDQEQPATAGGTEFVSTGASSTEKPIQTIIKSGPGFIVIQTPDGEVQRRTGRRNWRNNNPGNLEYGPFARSKGAIGTDGRFAVFPTLDQGMMAKRALVFGPRYINLTIAGAISKYAPPSENNTNSYINAVVSATGAGRNTPLSNLSASQQEAMLSAINRMEGFKVGSITTMAASAPVAESKKIPKRFQEPSTGINKFTDGERWNSDYKMYRLGLALAPCDGENVPDVDPESWVGRWKTAHPYTDTEQKMLKLAYKATKINYQDENHGDLKSMETPGVNTTSVIRDPHERKKKKEMTEDATAGATSSASIATVPNPHLSPGKARGMKSYTGSPGKSGTKSPPQPRPKNQKVGTNALDMKGVSIFGSPLKRR